MAESTSTNAGGMMKSKTSLVPTSAQPSEPVAASRFSTRTERPSLPFAANEEAVFVLLSVIDGLASNMLSGDMWELAMWKAEDSCKELGVSQERFREIIGILAEVRRKRLGGNPLSKMF